MVYIDQPVNMIVDRLANEYIVSAVGAETTGTECARRPLSPPSAGI